MKDEPAAYIHAKWVHLIHPDTETLLTGSANLSRSALLRSSSGGNIEMGVVSTGPAGTFDGLYAHLQRKMVNDVSLLGISYQRKQRGRSPRRCVIPGCAVEPPRRRHPEHHVQQGHGRGNDAGLRGRPRRRTGGSVHID